MSETWEIGAEVATFDYNGRIVGPIVTVAKIHKTGRIVLSDDSRQQYNIGNSPWSADRCFPTKANAWRRRDYVLLNDENRAQMAKDAIQIEAERVASVLSDGLDRAARNRWDRLSVLLPEIRALMAKMMPDDT